MTPLEVVQQLGRLTRELGDLVDALDAAEMEAARKRAAADRTESVAFLNAGGVMDMRKHTARIAASDEEEDALVAEAVVRVIRQRIKATEVRIDVGRTFGATVRAELSTLGYGGAP
jgi:hypothetical protein